LFDDARHRVPRSERPCFAELTDDLGQLDDYEDLAQAFGHPDLVPGNLIGAADDKKIVIDWTGAGRAPRVLSLGCLLWAAAKSTSCLRAAAASYGSFVCLDSLEIDRIEKAMWTRPLILACWSFATGRGNLPDLARWWQRERAKIRAGAVQVRSTLSESRPPGPVDRA
jgi:hypothetical protein